MKFSISFALLGITLGQYIICGQASPVSNHHINELNNVDEDSQEAIPSSEIMPGRFLTDKEVQNIVYLTYAQANENIGRKNRPKRSIADQPRQQRSFRNYIRRRQERIRLRNERRRLRLQKQRTQQADLLQDLTRQNEITRQRLQMLNLKTQQQALNTQQIRTQPQQLQVTTKSPQTAQVPISTVSTAVVQPVVVAEQVPIPLGKK